MLNEEKIRYMTELAIFEKNEGRKIFPVNRFFRSDYVAVRCSGAFSAIPSASFWSFSPGRCTDWMWSWAGPGPTRFLAGLKTGRLHMWESGFISCRYLEDQLPALWDSRTEPDDVYSPLKTSDQTIWKRPAGYRQRKTGRKSYMTGLLLWKEHLKGFYQKYNQLLHPLIRFLFTLCTVLSINSTVGYMAKLKNPLVVFMVCLVGTLLPNCMLVFLIGDFWQFICMRCL